MQVDSISLTADFFELGGNSLRAVMLARRVSDAFACELGVGDIMQYSTISSHSAAKQPSGAAGRDGNSSSCRHA